VLSPEIQVALINRTKQWNQHIIQRMETERERKSFAFVVAAIKEEWPESFKYRLALHFNLAEPYLLNLDSAFDDAERCKSKFQMKLLGYFLPMDNINDETDFECLQQILIEQLSKSKTPLFFYCYLEPSILKNQVYIQTIVAYWESLKLINSEKQHVLMMFNGVNEKGFLSHGTRKVERWRKALWKKIDKDQNSKIVVPPLQPPSREDINYWISKHLKDTERVAFEKAVKKIKGSSIPHTTLRHTYIEIVNK
jgi:hypothetical protein